MAEHARITPAGPSSSGGTRRPREDTPSIQPRTRTAPRQEFTLGGEDKLPWHDDIDRKTTLAHRKLVSQLITKERQLAEAEEHLERGTCPNTFKATAYLPVPDIIKAEVEESVGEIIRQFERSCVKVMVQVRKHEHETLKEELENIFLQHELEIGRRIDQLVAENILLENAWYDKTLFKAKLEEDGRMTRLLAFQANARKEEKRQKFAAKKAADQVDQTLDDPTLAELRKTVENLEKKVAKAQQAPRTKKTDTPKKTQKTSEKPKPKEADKTKNKRPGSKNGSGPGKTGRRGPAKAAKKGKGPAGASRRH